MNWIEKRDNCKSHQIKKMLKIAFDSIYNHKLKFGHRFPMEKYELLPKQLLRKNICNKENFSPHHKFKKRFYYLHMTKTITII